MFVISAEVPSSSSVIMLSNSDSRQWVTMVLPPGPGHCCPMLNKHQRLTTCCPQWQYVQYIFGDCQCQFIKVWSHVIDISVSFHLFVSTFNFQSHLYEDIYEVFYVEALV